MPYEIKLNLVTDTLKGSYDSLEAAVADNCDTPLVYRPVLPGTGLVRVTGYVYISAQELHEKGYHTVPDKLTISIDVLNP